MKIRNGPVKFAPIGLRPEPAPKRGTSLTVRLPEGVVKTLKEVCKNSGLSQSHIIEYLIEYGHRTFHWCKRKK